MSVHIELAVTIRVPREAVVRYFSRPDEYLAVHSRYYKSFHIRSMQQDQVYVDEVWELGGRRAALTHRIVCGFPERMDLEVVDGEGKGSTESILFEEVPRGTRVRFICDYVVAEIGNPVLRWFVRGQMRKMVRAMAEEDRVFLEARNTSRSGQARGGNEGKPGLSPGRPGP